MHTKFKLPKCQCGLSLIELVIFITILSITLTSITLIYINTTRHGADPMMRIRSVELAQSMLNEILMKYYDENTPLGGGCVKTLTNTNCTSTVLAASNDASELVPEEGAANRSLFDDVDDYNDLSYCGAGGVTDDSCTNTCQEMTDASGTSIKNEYTGYAICIRVSFAGGADAEINNVTPPPVTGDIVLTNDAKRIDVIVTDPLNSKIKLSAYRLNF